MAAERAWKLTRIRLRVLHARRLASTIGNRPRRWWRWCSATRSWSGMGQDPAVVLLRRESFTFLDQLPRASGLSWDWTPTSCRPCWTWKALHSASLATVGVNARVSRDTGLARTVQLAKAEPHWQD